MVSDSDGDDFEDATEFGVDDGEMFGVASSALRKSPMSKSYNWLGVVQQRWRQRGGRGLQN